MKVIGIARNYGDHAKELGNDAPVEPVFFLMSDSALLRNNNAFYIPDFSESVHYEVELVLKINRLGKNIAPRFASRYFDEIGIGIDFTARDIQQKAIREGLPWSLSKSFDGSCPLGGFVDKAKFADVNNINFGLSQNEHSVQQGNTKDMLFGFDQIIAHISKFMTLKIGDLIYTGTPAGVGPVAIGDHLQANIEGEVLLDFFVR